MKKPVRFLTGLAVGAALLLGAGCEQDIVTPNLVAGLQDGLVTATTGIIESAINALFEPAGGSAGNGGGSGNDQFAGI